MLLLTIQDDVLPNTKLINIYVTEGYYSKILWMMFGILAFICVAVWFEMIVSDFRQAKRDELNKIEYQKKEAEK
jgi:hypothetical protein